MHGYQESMLSNLISPEIKGFLAQKQFKELREALSDLEPSDIAEAIIGLTEDERAVVFRILPRQLSADVYENLPLYEQEELIRSLGQAQLSSIVNEMDPDDRTALLEELPGRLTKRLLGLLTPDERTVAKTLLGYPEDSIGRIMTPEYVSISQNLTVEETIEFIRNTAADKETIHVLYVTDDQDHLLAYLRVRPLIFSDPQKKISEIMNTQVIALNAFDDQETASNAMLKYDISVLPVCDSGGTLVGIVTSDDILDVVVEEATEDMHRMGGLNVVEEPYFHVPLLTLVKKRIGWLFVLFIGGIVLASVMEQFDSIIMQVAVLTFYLPLVISSGGNTGSQASTLIIRSLATQDVMLRDWYRVFLRELGSGLILGVLLGIVIFGWIIFYPPANVAWFTLSIMLLVSVISVVTFGAIMGSMLPFILRGFGFDPAFSSTPLIATLCDTIGVIIYFLLAIYFFQQINTAM
jgi:magnesium transporter